MREQNRWRQYAVKNVAIHIGSDYTYNFYCIKKNVIYHKGHLISLLYYALLHFLYLVVIIVQGCDCWKGGNNMSKKKKKWLHRETNDDALK